MISALDIREWGDWFIFSEDTETRETVDQDTEKEENDCREEQEKIMNAPNYSRNVAEQCREFMEHSRIITD